MLSGFFSPHFRNIGLALMKRDANEEPALSSLADATAFQRVAIAARAGAAEGKADEDRGHHLCIAASSCAH